MPEFFIRSTRPATVAVDYIVTAEDEHEAMRQVYDGKVKPLLVGIDHAGIPGTGDSIQAVWELPETKQKLPVR